MRSEIKSLPWYIIKLLFAAYLVSGVILLVLALMLWKGNPSSGVISGGILFAYLISCFTGGMLLGKKMGKRKYLWGLAFGLLYFAIVFVVSLFMRNIVGEASGNVITVMLLCAAGGMLGGMLG